MTIYGRSDITFVSLSEVGHTHEKKKGDDLIKITCAECEPRLLADGGWSTDPRHVEMTPDEMLDTELEREQIAAFERQRVADAAREAAINVRSGTRVSRGAARP